MVAVSARQAGQSAMPQPSAPRQAGVSPLIRQLNLQQLEERDEPKAPDPMMVIEEDVPELVGHVRLAWQRNRMAKEVIDRKLLACLRARRRVYSPAEIGAAQQTASGMNLVFTDLTETKCRAASAWIREILLPVGEQPWGVDPTPLPDLPLPVKHRVIAEALEQAKQVMQQAAEAGGGVMAPEEFRSLATDLGIKLRDEAEGKFRRDAKVRAKRMERVISDRLTQGNYAAAMDEFIEDFVTYPAAILKGPTYKRHRVLKWGPGYKPQVSNSAIPWWDRVSPFDAYPSANTRSPQKGDFIERMRFHREELYDLKGLPGYQDDQIDAALRDYVDGRLENWMWTEAERQRLEQETMYMWLSPQGVIDALNFWGRVPGWMLVSWGIEGVDDTTREYEVNVLLCGRYVLYAALNPDPLGQRPYRKACYDEIPGAFWGNSIPDLASTSQRMCNGIASAMADNMAMASGPMVWVHADRFADGENSMEIFPWKIWQLKSDPQAAGQAAPGIGFFQANDNSAALMANYEKWEAKADDSTGIPRYTYGNEKIGGAGNTLGGLQTLMSNAAKGLRRGISNADMNVISPTINDTFTNEMIYNPDESIKGDAIVVPRGAAAILIRESAQTKRMQFLQMTANPIDAQVITPKHRAVLLRETAAALELPEEAVPSEEELDESMQAQQQAAEKQMAMAEELEFKKLKFEHDLDMEKEAAIAAREGDNEKAKVMSSIVQTAVSAALADHSKAKENAEKKPAQQKRVKFTYDEAGNLVSGEREESEE
jgi:hypothetical protein